MFLYCTEHYKMSADQDTGTGQRSSKDKSMSSNVITSTWKYWENHGPVKLCFVTLGCAFLLSDIPYLLPPE
jgi:hypothetical protein